MQTDATSPRVVATPVESMTPSDQQARALNTSDRRLAARARRGSEEAITALVDRHWAGTYRVAVAILGDPHRAEDVAQEALLAAIEALPRFDLRRKFRPWLHRIAANKAIDLARRSAREFPREGVERAGQPSDAAELPTDLREALLRLDPENRAIFVLRHLFDYDSTEIGRMIGRPSGTIRRRLSETAGELRGELGGRHDA